MIIGAGIDRDLLIDDERLIEQARLAAAEKMGEQFERLRLAGLGGAIGGREIDALLARLLDLFIDERHETMGAGLGLLRADALGRRAARRDLAVICPARRATVSGSTSPATTRIAFSGV